MFSILTVLCLGTTKLFCQDPFSEKTVNFFINSAESGNSDSQIELGFMYAEGKGVEKNLEEAVQWYRKAAEQGNTIGQLLLARCYEKGNGVAISNEEALKWYLKVAENDDFKEQQYYVGLWYALGQGTHQNYGKAAYWYKRAAENGEGEAQYALADYYEKGRGVKRDINQAIKVVY